MNAETENKEKETKMEANSEDMSCKMEKETFEDDENKKEDTSKEEKENNDDKEDEEKVDYEAKYAEYENKIAEMEENNKAFMKELEELRKYKADKEEAERNFKAASLFDEVMDILPKEAVTPYPFRW
jgi:molecular chaperone GrpE (heat shock protein)